MSAFSVAPVTPSAAYPKTALAVCNDVSFGDNDEDDAKSAPGTYFNFAGACARLTGAINAYHQNTLSKSASGFAALIGSKGTPSSSNYVNTLEAVATIETRRGTALGLLETSLQVKWTKTSDDENDAGALSVQELYGALAGWTVGYTDSLMNFWSGDFQFSATSPRRTVGIVSYEHALSEELKLAVAVESGLPTSRQSSDGLASIDFDSPILTSRWRYENDAGVELHLSGLVRRAEFTADPRFPLLPRTADTRTGWAASIGASIPVRATGEDDSLSMQATYAVDASPFLGTTVDLSTLASIVPTTGPTRGWSVVASFNHAWTEQWESNVFVSYLALDARLLLASPSIETRRLAANLYWRPMRGLRFGAEIGMLELDFVRNGLIGLPASFNSRAVLGYLSAEWSF